MSTTRQRHISEQLIEEGAAPPPIQQAAPGQKGLLESLLSRKATASISNTHISGVLIGCLVDIDDRGTPMVTVPEFLPEPHPTVSLSPLTKDHIGAQCAVMFSGGNLTSPILMGMLHHNVLTLSHPGKAQVQDDGERLCIEHAQEIALHCGKASLRLTRDGRIELRGTSLISHSTGLNRVRGASVKLN
ncbi:DUF6484 domain-containing protein [Pseudomonas carnis]|uniref:DUF6484 domain-containing protein n=1 Tax=Pseudomonas carnis TaxID=2487355 RepID=UPI001BC91E89|nr:DUF6484 domain-containing protein [Pseudomonas carnis]